MNLTGAPRAAGDRHRPYACEHAARRAPGHKIESRLAGKDSHRRRVTLCGLILGGGSGDDRPAVADDNAPDDDCFQLGVQVAGAAVLVEPRFEIGRPDVARHRQDTASGSASRCKTAISTPLPIATIAFCLPRRRASRRYRAAKKVPAGEIENPVRPSVPPSQGSSARVSATARDQQWCVVVSGVSYEMDTPLWKIS